MVTVTIKGTQHQRATWLAMLGGRNLWTGCGGKHLQ